MALFKIFKGTSANLGQTPAGNDGKSDTSAAHEGYAYFTTDDGKFYIDIADGETAVATYGSERNRIPISAEKADRDSEGNIIIEKYLTFDNNNSTQVNYNESYLPLSGGELQGSLTINNYTNASNKQVRNIIVSTSAPVNNSNDSSNVGDIWIVYSED